MFPLAWLVGLALPALAATTPITLDSYAAPLDYQPNSSNLNGGPSSWNASFTGFPWSERQGGKRGGQIGTGVGYHWIRGDANPNAVVNYEFYGTGVEFFGYFGYLGTGAEGAAGNGEVRLSISGGPDKHKDVTTAGMMTGRATSLGKYADLPLGQYTVTMRPSAGVVSFTHLVVQMEVGGDANAVSQALANPRLFNPYTVGADNALTPDPAWGTFKGANGTGGWAGQQSNDNRRVGTKVFGDSVEIQLGTGNSFLSINGTSNSNHGMFRVEFDPAPPSGNGRVKHWARTSWQVLETVLVATGLDPDTEYKVTLTNLQDDDKAEDKLAWFDITNLVLWKVPTDAKPKAGNVIGSSGGGQKDKAGAPIGAIVGGVVGGVAVLVAIGFAWWYFTRRQRSPTELARASSYTNDPESYVTTPFVIDPSPANEAPHPQQAYQQPQMTMLHPYSGLSGPSTVASSERQMSWSEASSSP
jgi:hypothetical protein